MDLPKLPYAFGHFLPSLKQAKSRQDVQNVVEPFKNYESKLRQIFAQEPSNPAIGANHLVPVFAGQTSPLTIRARDLAVESDQDRDKYLLPLSDKTRRKDGSIGTVSSLKEFKTNFNLFSESSLVDLDWSNVVAAGSSVVTPLLPVDAPHNDSKRTLRAYYHEQLAPASDVDLFIYGLNEEQAMEKIKQIEARVRDSILAETTTVRTKNAITIVSEYPTRHIQIVLRLYKSVSEILTGFDVDCACVAYDGKQVWASPRALGAFATQTNSIDLTRRSPSYENRLSKYAQRGFEVYWPSLDRSHIDPTIYERAFNRVQGLARLLVLEKLPHPHDRDEYLTKRRKERGRPDLPWNHRYRHELPGNVKDAQPHDVAEWVDEDDVSSYHTFTIPYGPKYNPRKVEKLIYTKDLLLNAEWNKQKDRTVNLHRHPAFFGTVEEVSEDCCGFCPKPETDDELAAWEEESKTFVSGKLQFIKDDPGRQAVGSFNPITDVDWTEMAYVGNTTMLCQAIVDQDLEAVQDWFETTEDADVNRRDHTGRTPLHLAAMCSTPEIVQCLIEHNARIVARIYNGFTALHIAAHRGNAQIVKLLLEKSEQNEEEEDRKEELRKQARRAAANSKGEPDQDTQMSDASSEPEDLMDEDTNGEVSDQTTEGSFVKLGKADEQDNVDDDDSDDPDVYDIDVLSWDTPVSPLHLAIMAGHEEVITVLIDEFGADVMLPVKTEKGTRYNPGQVILSLLLPMKLPLKKANDTVRLLLQKGASPSQADARSITALHYLVETTKTLILDTLQQKDSAATKKVLDHLVLGNYEHRPTVDCALLTAIRTGSTEMCMKLIEMGTSPMIKLENFAKAFDLAFDRATKDPDQIKKIYQQFATQPIIQAATQESSIEVVEKIIDMGVDVNTLSGPAYESLLNPNGYHNDQPKSLLDILEGHLKSLKEYSEKEPQSPNHHLIATEPGKIQSDEYYLKDVESGSYQFWKLSKDLDLARSFNVQLMKEYHENLRKKEMRPDKAEYDKREAVKAFANRYEQLIQKLKSKGAKTFKELHPDHKPRDPYQNYGFQNNEYNNYSTEEWKPELKFQVADLTDSKREAYTNLFQAAFTGDVRRVKSLCLEGQGDYGPLLISVNEDSGFNAFSIAVLRGHEELARLVLEIAASQYEPREETYHSKYVMFKSQDEEADEDEDSGDENETSDIEIEKEEINDVDAVDDVTARGNKVKCQVKPKDLLWSTCELWRTVPGDTEKARQMFPTGIYVHTNCTPADIRGTWSLFRGRIQEEKNKLSHNLVHSAVVRNDIPMLKFLLEMEEKYADPEDGKIVESIQFPENDFILALKMGHVEMVSEIIKQRGVFFPLEAYSRRSGVKTEENPTYYQGLNVHGKKRKDWAKKAQRQRGYHQPALEKGAPLLTAILNGTRDIIDYFLSDAVLRHYEEFATKFAEDKRVQQLMQAPGGFSAALRTWMQTRVNLALHMAVLAWPGGSLPRLRSLIERLPLEYLEVKNVQGMTPLHLAFQANNVPVAEALIAAGANVTTRNLNGDNILHTIYQNSRQGPEYLKRLVSLLDESAVNSMVCQRGLSAGGTSQTPLASVLPNIALRTKDDLVMLDTMLGISKGKDLEIIDGAGDYPLHVQVRNNNLSAVRYIASKRPDLLYRENATGITPIEVAELQYFQDRMKYAPSISDRHNHYGFYQPPNDRLQNITNKPARDFAKEQEVAKDQMDPFEGLEEDEEDDSIQTYHSMYRLLCKLAKRNPGKRTLVSILDANEVAKRLAYQQKKKNEETREREAKGLRSYRSWRSRYYYNYDENGNTKQKHDETTELWNAGPVRITSLTWWKRIEIDGVEEGLAKLRALAEGETIQCCDDENHEGFVKVGPNTLPKQDYPHEPKCKAKTG